MTADFKLIKQKVVHKWAAWALVQADFADPAGEKFVRTYVDSPGAVGVVALVGEVGARRVLLVRQDMLRVLVNQEKLKLNFYKESC